MKKSFAMLRYRFCPLTAILAAGLMAEEAKPPEQPAGIITKAKVPVVIDGALDDAVWKEAQPVRVDYVKGKVGVLSQEPRMVTRYAWDDRYLYIGYETFDKNLIALSEPGSDGPLDNQRQNCSIWHTDPAVKVDVVEFFISFGNQNFIWEVHHNALNHFNDVLCMVNLPGWDKEKPAIARFDIYFAAREFIQDEGKYKLAVAARLKPKADGLLSTPNDESDTDAGYVGEIRLPWYGVGAPLKTQTTIVHEPKEEGQPRTTEPGPWQMAAQEIRLLAVFQDGDIADRYHHSGATFNPGWFHQCVKDYPWYRFGGENTKPPK